MGSEDFAWVSWLAVHYLFPQLHGPISEVLRVKTLAVVPLHIGPSTPVKKASNDEKLIHCGHVGNRNHEGAHDHKPLFQVLDISH